MSTVNPTYNLQTTINSMSGAVSSLKWNPISLRNWNAVSNTNYIWNLPDIRSATGGAVVTFPASPSDNDFIEIIDGLGTWGNTLYGNIGINLQGKNLIGMTPTGTVSLTGVAGGFYDFRKGSVLFTYKSANNTWYANGTVSVSMGSEYNEVVSTSVDPWSGWWMFSSQTSNQLGNFVSKYGTQRLNGGGANANLSYAYIDASLYPISVTLYSNHPSNPVAGGAVYARCFEYLQTGASTDITTLVHINSQVGTQANVPATKYWVGGATTNTQGASFKLQTDRSVCAVTWDQTVPMFTSSVNNQSAIMKKLISLPGYSQKNQVEASVSRFNDDFDIANEENFDDMTVLFKQMCLAAIYDSNPQTQQSSNGSGRFLYQNDNNYFIGNTGPFGYELGALKAIEVLNQFLSPEGITFTTPITKILKSFTGPNGNIQVPVGGGSTKVTTIFTKGISYAAPGSNVTITGLNDTWTGVNGYYQNGVSVYENGCTNRKFTDPFHMDLYQSGDTYTGTLTDAWNRFNLIVDTWSPSFDCIATGPYKNFAIYSSTAAAVSVTHRVYPTMPYNEFYAAVCAFCQYVFGPITHTRVQGKTYLFNQDINSIGRVAVNWRKLTDTSIYTLYSTNVRLRTEYNGTPASYYIYGVPSRSDLLMRNDPYSVVNVLNSLKTTLGITASNLPLVPENYLTGARDLWVGMDSIQTYDPVIKPYGYTSYEPYAQAGTLLALRNISYTGYTGGTTFVGRLFPVGAVPTGAGPFDANPDYRYWLPFYSTAGFTGAAAAIANAKTFSYRCCGMIKPEYTNFEGYPGWSGATGTRKIGYWIQPSTTMGMGGLIYTSPFCPSVNPASVTGPYNPSLATGPFKPFSAALTNVYATVMNYLVGELGCDSIIIDNRNNLGGAGAEGIEIAEFFGDTRQGTKVFLRRADNGFGTLLDLDSYQWPLNGQNLISQKNAQLNVTTNAINYPNAIFKGTGTSNTGARKVVMLTSSAALSNGSRFQRNWLGDNADKKIGGNTIVKFIGSSDSRFQGTSVSSGFSDTAPEFGSDYVSSGTTYMQMNIETPTYGLVAQNIPVGKTGALWYHRDYPGLTGATSVNQAKNGVVGTNGVGYALPENLQSTLYADWGAYTGAYAEQIAKYPTMYLPGKTTDLDTRFGAGNWPVLSNYRTWRDSWLETAIYEAMVPVLPGEN